MKYITKINSKSLPDSSYTVIKSTYLGDLFITISTVKDQLQIVNQIESESSKINNTVSIKRTQIERLKEYKSILIDNASEGIDMVDFTVDTDEIYIWTKLNRERLIFSSV